jgi:acyl-CoA synthetase (AMP-forming)/AMP-acid ligase II
MKRHASEAGDLLAVSDRYGQLSHHELFVRVTALAADLKGQPGTIGIYAPNGIGWAVAQLACAFAGKIVVPLPTFLARRNSGTSFEMHRSTLFLPPNKPQHRPFNQVSPPM